MSLKTRRIIFYSFLFLFILTCLGVVFYSRGWRVDITNCHLTRWRDCEIGFNKIGAIFIETKTKGAVIKIDGKTFTDKSGLMQAGTLITNLLPKIYKVGVEKDGYRAWQKDIPVEPALVAEVLKVILVPEKLKKIAVAISKPIGDFWFSPQQKIIFKSNGALYYSQDFSAFTKLRGDEFVSWSEDGSKIISQDSKNQIYYLYDSASLLKALNINVAFNNFQKTNIVKIAFHPADSGRLIIGDKNDLYLLDPNRPQLENLLKGPLLAWTIKNPNIYYIKTQINTDKNTDKNGYNIRVNPLSNPRESVSMLGSFNLVSKTEDLIFELPYDLINQKPIKMAASGNKIAILTNNGGLYLFNQQTQKLEQIAHSAKDFLFSPDNKKIVFFDSDGKLNIYFLEDYQIGIRKKAGEVIRSGLYLKETNRVIKDIFWHQDSSHLFINYLDADKSEKIDFMEIDDRSPINKYMLVEGASNFYYELKSNRIYFVQENNLYFLEI